MEDDDVEQFFICPHGVMFKDCPLCDEPDMRITKLLKKYKSTTPP